MSRPEPGSARDLIELILGYGLILFILWMPESPQIFSLRSRWW
jgi:hypothetical protein